MPVRLTLLLGLVLSFFLLIAYLNPEVITLRLWRNLDFRLNLSVVMMVTFITGVLSVYFVFFYDTVADLISSLKQTATRNRHERVGELYAAAEERLALDNRRDAEKYLRKGLSHDADHLPTLITLGRLLRQRGEIGEATRLHARANGLKPQNAIASLELAHDYVAARNPENAMTILQTLRKQNRRSAPPLRAMRDLFSDAGNFAEAAALQKEIVSHANWDHEDYEKRLLAALTYADGSTALARGDLRAARAAMKSALRQDATFMPAYLKLADVAEREGNQTEATKTLEHGFQATHSLVILKFFETLLLRRGEEKLVAGRYRWARDQAPDKPIIRLLLAVALLKEGEWQEVERQLQSVSGDLVATPLYHLLFAMTQKHNGNIDVANKALAATLAAEVTSIFRFHCDACHQSQSEYADRCSNCGAWGSLSV